MRQLFSLRAACYFLFAVKIFPNLFALMPIDADRMPHFLWQEVSMEHQLPNHPVTIGSATALGDFIAIVNNQQQNEIFFRL